MTPEDLSPRVLVVHSGARHNYALPAAFASHNMLEAFYTDVCAGRGFGRIAEWASGFPLPTDLKQKVARFSARRPPDGVLAKTSTDDFATLAYELRVRQIGDPAARRQEHRKYAKARNKRLAAKGLGNATHLFNVLGEGGELALQARERGIPVIADTIIALSTARIHFEEFEAFPDWGPPPPDRPEPDFPTPPYLLEATDVFVCPSPFVADDLVENFGVKRASTHVVPYALSETWFDIVPRPEVGRVLFAGTADRRKGIHYLAKAAKRLASHNPSVEFRVAGGVHETVRLHPEASELTFLGRVPRDKIKAEFAAADLFVLPTLAEGSATVVYEAMAAGLPVITTRSAGSVIENGIDGLIVPERDPDALAGAIERLISDRRMRNRIGKAAKERALEAFGWDIWAENLVGLVRSISIS